MSESVFRHLVTRIGQAPAGVSSIRGALLAGFAVLLAVWAFAGYELIRSLGDVERRVTAEHDAFARELAQPGEDRLLVVAVAVETGDDHHRIERRRIVDRRLRHHRHAARRRHRPAVLGKNVPRIERAARHAVGAAQRVDPGRDRKLAARARAAEIAYVESRIASESTPNEIPGRTRELIEELRYAGAGAPESLMGRWVATGHGFELVIQVLEANRIEGFGPWFGSRAAGTQELHADGTVDWIFADTRFSLKHAGDRGVAEPRRLPKPLIRAPSPL